MCDWSNLMCAEYRDEPKYKRYEAAMERTLLSFETISEWADIIAFLTRLTKTISSFPMFEVIPNKLLVSKRLAQCLNPNLPTGVHQRTLETYAQIFEKIGTEGLIHDLALYSAGLLSFFGSASSSTKLELICIIEKYILQLEEKIEPVLSGLLFAICTGFEDEIVEGMAQFEQIFLRLISIFGEQKINGCIWRCLKMTSIHRISFLMYFLKRYPIKSINEDTRSLIFSPDYYVAIDGICLALEDSSLLVVRMCLDLLCAYIPFRSLTESKDSLQLVGCCVKCFSKKDASINRRIFNWISLELIDHHSCELIRRSIIATFGHSHASDNIRALLRSLMFVIDQTEWLHSVVAPVSVDLLIITYQDRALYSGISSFSDFFKQMDLLELWGSIGNRLTNSTAKERDILIDSLIYGFTKYKICEDEASWMLIPIVLDVFLVFCRSKGFGESLSEKHKTFLLIKEGLDHVNLATFENVSLFMDSQYNSTCSILQNIAGNLMLFIMDSRFESLDEISLKYLSSIVMQIRTLIPVTEQVLCKSISMQLTQFITDNFRGECDWQILIPCINIILDVCQDKQSLSSRICDIFMKRFWIDYESMDKAGQTLLWRFNSIVPFELDLHVSSKLPDHDMKFIHIWLKTITYQESSESCRIFPNSIRLLLDTLVNCPSAQSKLSFLLNCKLSCKSVMKILLESWYDCCQEDSLGRLDFNEQHIHLLKIFSMIVLRASQSVYDNLTEDYLSAGPSCSFLKTPNLLECYDQRFFPLWLVLLQNSVSLMISKPDDEKIQLYSQGLCIDIIERFNSVISPRIAKSLLLYITDHFKEVGLLCAKSIPLIFDAAYISSRTERSSLQVFITMVENILLTSVSTEELEVLATEIMRRGAMFDDSDFHKICKATLTRLSSLFSNMKDIFAPEYFAETLFAIFIVAFDQFKAFSETSAEVANDDSMSLAGKLRQKLSNPPVKYVDCSGIVLLPDLLDLLRISQTLFPEYFQRIAFVSNYELFIQKRLSAFLSSIIEQGILHVEKSQSFQSLYTIFSFPRFFEKTIICFIEESNTLCLNLKDTKYNDNSKTWEGVLIFVLQLWKTAEATLIKKTWGTISVLLREVINYSNKYRCCIHVSVSLCVLAMEKIWREGSVENSQKTEIEEIFIKTVEIAITNSTKLFEIFSTLAEDDADIEQPIGPAKDRNCLKCCYSICNVLLPKIFANEANYSTPTVLSGLQAISAILMPLLRMAKRPRHANQMVRQGLGAVISRNDYIHLWRKEFTEMFQADYFWEYLSFDSTLYPRILDCIRELLRLDSTKLQDLTGKSPSSGSNIFLSKDLDRISRALSIRRVALAVLCSTADTIKSIMSEIQEMYVENLRSDQYSTSKEALLLLRCIIYKIGNEVSSAFWPIVLSYSLTFMKGILKIEKFVDIPRKQLSVLNQLCLLRRQIVTGKLYIPMMSLLPLMEEINDSSLFSKLRIHFRISEGLDYEDPLYVATFVELQKPTDEMEIVEIGDFYSDLVSIVEQD